MKDLNVAAIQHSLIWDTPEANREVLGAYIEQEVNSEVDLIVLPEMFTTGFSMDTSKAEAYSEDMDTIQWMKAIAKAKDAAITGSIKVKDGEYFFNRLLFVQPDGTVDRYDKKHLFTFAQEDRHYKAGDEQLVVEFKGWRICPLICYDLRFPEWARNVEGKQPRYDVLLYVANWPAVRSAAWCALLYARSIENQCYLVGVNRVGEDQNGIKYNGSSLVLNPKGGVIQDAQLGEAKCLLGSFSWSELAAFREKFPVIEDADFRS